MSVETGRITYSANAPSTSTPMRTTLGAEVRSAAGVDRVPVVDVLDRDLVPGSTRSTPGPTASTTPAASCPGTPGSLSRAEAALLEEEFRAADAARLNPDPPRRAPARGPAARRAGAAHRRPAAPSARIVSGSPARSAAQKAAVDVDHLAGSVQQPSVEHR